MRKIRLQYPCIKLNFASWQSILVLGLAVLLAACSYGKSHPRPKKSEPEQVLKENPKVYPAEEVSSLLVKYNSNRWDEIPPGARAILAGYVQVPPQRSSLPPAPKIELTPQTKIAVAPTSPTTKTPPMPAETTEDLATIEGDLMLGEIAESLGRLREEKQENEHAATVNAAKPLEMEEKIKVINSQIAANPQIPKAAPSPFGHPQPTHALPKNEFSDTVSEKVPAPISVAQDKKKPYTRSKLARFDQEGKTAATKGKVFSLRNALIILSVILLGFFIVIGIRFEQDQNRTS